MTKGLGAYRTGVPESAARDNEWPVSNSLTVPMNGDGFRGEATAKHSAD